MAAGFYDLFSLLYHWFASVRIRVEGDGGVTTSGGAEYIHQKKHITKGVIEIDGCADCRISSIVLLSKFTVRSFAYIKKDALNGVLTKIFIKHVKFNEFTNQTIFLRYVQEARLLHFSDVKSYNDYINHWYQRIGTPIYVEINNSIYNEYELCTLSEAQDLIDLYLEKYRVDSENNIKNC